MNQRQDQVSGGNDRMALPLNAARVTTNAGKIRKPRIAATVVPPRSRNNGCADPSRIFTALRSVRMEWLLRASARAPRKRGQGPQLTGLLRTEKLRSRTPPGIPKCQPH